MIKTLNQKKCGFHRISITLQIILLISALTVLLQPAHAAVYEPAGGPYSEIVAQGQAKAQIVIPAESTENESFAALELQTYLEKISTAKIPIVPEGGKLKYGYTFFIQLDLNCEV